MIWGTVRNYPPNYAIPESKCDGSHILKYLTSIYYDKVATLSDFTSTP
jgi:hypothetical protein